MQLLLFEKYSNEQKINNIFRILVDLNIITVITEPSTQNDVTRKSRENGFFEQNFQTNHLRKLYHVT